VGGTATGKVVLLMGAAISRFNVFYWAWIFNSFRPLHHHKQWRQDGVKGNRGDDKRGDGTLPYWSRPARGGPYSRRGNAAGLTLTHSRVISTDGRVFRIDHGVQLCATGSQCNSGHPFQSACDSRQCSSPPLA